MSKKINISKYQGNTHYSVHVIDSFGQEHHFGYCSHITPENNEEIEEFAEKIWKNEKKNEPSSMSKAIAECIEIDKKAGITSEYRDCLD